MEIGERIEKLRTTSLSITTRILGLVLESFADLSEYLPAKIGDKTSKELNNSGRNI